MNKQQSLFVRIFIYVLFTILYVIASPLAQAQPTNLNMLFMNDSGYEDNQIWFSWLRSGQPGQTNLATTNLIYYGAGNSGLVNWSNSGSNLMSDMISYTQLTQLISSSDYTGFNVASADSVNLFVSYGSNATYATLASAPSYNNSSADLFPYMPIELAYATNNAQSGGDVTAINVFSITLGIQNYQQGVSHITPTNFVQKVGFNTNAQTIFNNSIAPLVSYTSGQIDNPSVIVDAQSNVLRVVPVNSQTLGNIGNWQTFSNYLSAIQNTAPTNGGNVLVTNQNGFFNYSNTNDNWFFAYNMTASVNTNNDVVLAGQMIVYTNFGSGLGTYTTLNNLTNTLFGAKSTNLTFMGLNNGAITSTSAFFASQTTSNTLSDQDSIQSYMIYNQGNAYNTGYSETYTNLANIFITNNIVQGGITTNSPQMLWNAMNVMLQNPMGDYTTGIAGGFVISGFTNSAITNALGTYSTLDWFSGIGTNIPSFFGTLQPTNTFYNLYAGVITDNSSNSVYSIPFGDRLTGNTVTIGAREVGSTNIDTWLVTLGQPITPVGVPPTPSDKTNIIDAISLTTNGAYNVGNTTDEHLLEITNGGVLTITNAPGQTISARIGNTTSAPTNAAIVTGAGSIWSNAQTVIVGNNSAGNTLIVSNGGSFFANELRVGANATSSNNTVFLHGAGSQIVLTNAAGTGAFNLLRGTNTQNGGTLRTDNLNVNGSQAFFNFNGGTAFVGVASISNGQNFQVGNGSSAALFRLAQNGQTNTFANGLTINTNAIFSLGGFVTNQITLNGGTLKGQGTYVGNLTVGNGSTLSVGNSPGSITNDGILTWAGGGTNVWEINNFGGSSGVNWDFINVTGYLDITANNLNPFIVDITSLTFPGNTLGAASGFNDAANYNFVLVQSALGISNFNASSFSLKTNNFANPFAGTWSLGVTGNNLMLNYTATVVPEPSTYALMIFGALALLGAWFKHRRAQKVRQCAE